MPTSIFKSDSLLNSEMELPEDSTVWSQKISETLFSIHPELTPFPSSLNIDKFEPIKLYAKGTYTFEIGGHTVVFPIIVKSKRLQPMDVALVDDDWRPITSEYIEELATGDQLGEATDNTSGFYTRSAPIGGTRVPHETTTTLNPGVEFAGGGRYITASAQRKLIDRVKNDPKIAAALRSNANAYSAFDKILTATPVANAIKAAAVVRKDSNTAHVSVKFASGDIKTEVKTLAEVKPFITKISGDNAYVDFLKTGGVTKVTSTSSAISTACIDNIAKQASDLSSIIPQILEKITGSGSPLKGGIFSSDGGISPTMIIKIKRAKKHPIHGEHGAGMLGMGGGLRKLFSMLDKPAVGIHGADDMPCMKSDELPEFEDETAPHDTVLPMISEAEAIEPIRVERVMHTPMAKIIIGKTADGGDVFTGIIMKQLDAKIASVAEDISKSIPTEGRMFLPATTKLVKIAMDSSHVATKAELKHVLTTKAASLGDFKTLLKTGSNEYTFDGVQYIGINNVKAAMAMAEINDDLATDFLKVAESKRKVTIYCQTNTDNAIMNKVANAADWIKIASILRDTEESVNSVLSLGLNDGKSSVDKPEVLSLINQIESKLAKLLVAARLGDENIDQSEISDAIGALQEVAVSLKS